MRQGKVLSGRDFSGQEVIPCAFGSFQAEELRRTISEKKATKAAAGVKRSISIISGKGGVGKSNIALNLALAFGKHRGIPTAIIDADLGLANTDVLLGLDARLTLENVFTGELSVRDILVPVSDKVWLVPGGSGIPELADMSPIRRKQLLPEMLTLDDIVDVIVIDAGAGIHATVRDFALASDVVVVVATPEPTAVKDAYSMIKSISTSPAICEKELFLVVNMAFSEREAAEAAKRLIDATGRFLGIDLKYLGPLLHDPRIPKSVKAKCPALFGYPDCAFSRGISRITERLLPHSAEASLEPARKEGAMKRLVASFIGRKVLS